MHLTREQREALHRVYQRHFVEAESRYTVDMPTYLQFRRTAQMASYDNCVMVPIPHINMWLGIEPDGYTHS